MFVLLGVMISSDLSLEKHVDTVCSKCFFWLRQLKRVRRSVDAESMKTLVHAFVTSRVDYCNIILVVHQIATCSERCCADCDWHQEV